MTEEKIYSHEGRGYEKNPEIELNGVIENSKNSILSIFQNAQKQEVKPGNKISDFLLGDNQKRLKTLIYKYYSQSQEDFLDFKMPPGRKDFMLIAGKSISVPSEEDCGKIILLMKKSSIASQTIQSNKNVEQGTIKNLTKVEIPDIFPNKPKYSGFSGFANALKSNEQSGTPQPLITRYAFAEGGKLLQNTAACSENTQGNYEQSVGEENMPVKIRKLFAGKLPAWEFTRSFSSSVGFQRFEGFNPNNFFSLSGIKNLPDKGPLIPGKEEEYKKALAGILSKDIPEMSLIGFYYVSSKSKEKVFDSNAGKSDLHPNTHIGVSLGKGELSYNLQEIPYIENGFVVTPKKGQEKVLSPEEIQRKQELDKVNGELGCISFEKLESDVFQNPEIIAGVKKFEEELDNFTKIPISFISEISLSVQSQSLSGLKQTFLQRNIKVSDEQLKNILSLSKNNSSEYLTELYKLIPVLTRQQVLKSFASKNPEEILKLLKSYGINQTPEYINKLIGYYDLRNYLLQNSKEQKSPLNEEFIYIPENLPYSNEVKILVGNYNTSLDNFYANRDKLKKLSPGDPNYQTLLQELTKSIKTIKDSFEKTKEIIKKEASNLETKGKEIESRIQQDVEYVSRLKKIKKEDILKAFSNRDVNALNSYFGADSGKYYLHIYSKKELFLDGAKSLLSVVGEKQKSGQLNLPESILNSTKVEDINLKNRVLNYNSLIAKKQELEVPKTQKEVLDVFINFAQARADFSGTTSSIVRKNIISNLQYYGENIELFVENKDGKRTKINLKEELNKKDPSQRIKMSEDDKIVFGGSMVSDGLHKYSSSNPEERKLLHTRVRFIWEHLLHNKLYPTEILTPPKDIAEKFVGNADEKIKVKNTFSLGKGQKLETVLKGLIPSFEKEKFANIPVGSPEYNNKVDYLFSLQMKAYMLNGLLDSNMKFKKGIGAINQAMPYYEATGGNSIQKLFYDYVRAFQRQEVKQELDPQIEGNKNHILYTTKYGDDIGSIYRQVVLSLDKILISLQASSLLGEFGKPNKNNLENFLQKYPYLAHLKDLTPFQREELLKFILSKSNKEITPEDIKKGNIKHGLTFLIPLKDLNDKIQELFSQKGSSINFAILSPVDRYIIESASSNPAKQRSLAISISAESYVPKDGSGIRKGLKVGKEFIEDLLRNFGKVNNLSAGPYQLRLASLQYGYDQSWLTEQNLLGAVEFFKKTVDGLEQKGLLKNSGITPRDIEKVNRIESIISQIKAVLEKNPQNSPLVLESIPKLRKELATILLDLSLLEGNNTAGKIIQTYLASKLIDGNQQHIMGYIASIGHEINPKDNSHILEVLTGASFNRGIGNVLSVVTESAFIRYLTNNGVSKESIVLPSLEKSMTSFSYNINTFVKHLNYLSTTTFKNSSGETIKLPEKILQLNSKIQKANSDLEKKYAPIENPVGPGYIYEPKKVLSNQYQKDNNNLDEQIRGWVNELLKDEEIKTQIGSIWPTIEEINDPYFAIRKEVMSGYGNKYKNFSEYSPFSQFTHSFILKYFTKLGIDETQYKLPNLIEVKSPYSEINNIFRFQEYLEYLTEKFGNKLPNEFVEFSKKIKFIINSFKKRYLFDGYMNETIFTHNMKTNREIFLKSIDELKKSVNETIYEFIKNK